MKQEKEHLLDVRGVQRGDIYYVHPENGNPKLMLVVSDCTVRNDGLLIMLPLILEDRNPNGMHCEVFTKLPAWALCDQPKVIPEKWLGDYLRSATEKEMEAVNHWLAFALGLPEPLPFEIPDEALRSGLGTSLSKCEELRKENFELREEIGKFMVRLDERTELLQKAEAEISNMREDATVMSEEIDRLQKLVCELKEEKRQMQCLDNVVNDVETEFYKAQYNQLIDKLLAR